MCQGSGNLAATVLRSESSGGYEGVAPYGDLSKVLCVREAVGGERRTRWLGAILVIAFCLLGRSSFAQTPPSSLDNELTVAMLLQSTQ